MECNFSSLFFRLKDDARHVDVQSFFVQVTGNFDLGFLRLLVSVVCVPALIDVVAISLVDSILNSDKDALDGVVSDVSVHDQSQFLLFTLQRLLRENIISLTFRCG